VAHSSNQETTSLPETKPHEFRRQLRLLFRNRLSALGSVLIIVLLLAAIFAPFVARYDPLAVDIPERLQPPNPNHWFGTDDFGRDIMSRVIWGSRISLRLAIVVVVMATGLGAFIGAIAGFFGGRVDEVLMRITDVFLAFPALILAMAVAATLGPSLTNVMIAVSITWWPWYARLMRGQILSVKEEEFVEAANAMGASSLRIIFRHLVLNSLAPIMVQASMDLGYVILTATSLSFIGLGAQPPTPEWGAMITVGRDFIISGEWWMTLFPGLAIAFTVLGFNLLGDGLRDVLDPKLKGSGY